MKYRQLWETITVVVFSVCVISVIITSYSIATISDNICPRWEHFEDILRAPNNIDLLAVVGSLFSQQNGFIFLKTHKTQATQTVL